MNTFFIQILFASIFTVLWLPWKQICTRHAGSQSDKCNGIDAAFEVEKAAMMASDISDDGSVSADEGDRNDKGGITVQKFDPNETEYYILRFFGNVLVKWITRWWISSKEKVQKANK